MLKLGREQLAIIMQYSWAEVSRSQFIGWRGVDKICELNAHDPRKEERKMNKFKKEKHN